MAEGDLIERVDSMPINEGMSLNVVARNQRHAEEIIDSLSMSFWVDKVTFELTGRTIHVVIGGK